MATGSIDATATVTVDYNTTTTPPSTTSPPGPTRPRRHHPTIRRTAADDTATVTEDDAATAIDVLANDSDPEGDPFTIDTVTQPANGTVAITGGGSGLTYLPDPNYCNDPPGTTLDTFDYTLTPGGSTATVAVTVTCVADDPVAVDDSATVTRMIRRRRSRCWPTTAIPMRGIRSGRHGDAADATGRW